MKRTAANRFIVILLCRTGWKVGGQTSPARDFNGTAALNLTAEAVSGPGNAYWHTTDDTMDKLGAHSFEVIGNVLMRVIPKLEAEKT